MSERLFSYGTLRDPKVQRAVFGREVAGTPDALVGFVLKPVTISNRHSAAIAGTDAHTILEPGDGPPIEGLALELTPDELARADAYESAEYKRVAIHLRSGRDAWVYVRA
ncbi:MAG: gamma-glutamylcyclotransferase family protein [Rhizomicrobium sp.]